MWLSNLWDSVKEFFGERKYTSTAGIKKKKFSINNNKTREIEVAKKFEIKEERQTPARKNGKLTITSESRPRNCVRCRSTKTIVKSQQSGTSWECNIDKGGCGYRW